MESDREELSLFVEETPAERAPGRHDLVAYRYCGYDVPFWARPNTRSGRWHQAATEPTQYWSLTPAGAWAELIRFEELSSEEELDQVRMPIWVCYLSSSGLADLRRPEVCRRFDLTEEDLISDDWQACQTAASDLRREFRGVLAPSAALPGETNLTLFGGRRMIDFNDDVALASAVPAAMVAIGRPPASLLPKVRRRHRHPTLF